MTARKAPSADLVWRVHGVQSARPLVTSCVALLPARQARRQNAYRSRWLRLLLLVRPLEEELRRGTLEKSSVLS